MELSPQFHVAGLLHDYLAQDFLAVDFVRDQILTNTQKDAITEALRKVGKNWRDLVTDYDRFANFSGLDWGNQNEIDRVMPWIRSALFDLTLADETRRIHLNRYQEIHTVRNVIHAFFVDHVNFLHARCEPGSLWWDEIKLGDSPRKQWVSPHLASSKDLGKLVFSWSTDSLELQRWLRDYERWGLLRNNRREQSVGVFSGNSAAAIMSFAKV